VKNYNGSGVPALDYADTAYQGTGAMYGAHVVTVDAFYKAIANYRMAASEGGSLRRYYSDRALVF